MEGGRLDEGEAMNLEGDHARKTVVGHPDEEDGVIDDYYCIVFGYVCICATSAAMNSSSFDHSLSFPLNASAESFPFYYAPRSSLLNVMSDSHLSLAAPIIAYVGVLSLTS